MNRNHKYRAWDAGTEEWFYSDKPDDIHFFAFEDGTLKGFAIRPPRASNDPMEPPEPYCDEYEPFDFTGKKDIDGMDIWEGDKVEYYIRKKRLIGQIAWGRCGFWLVGEIDKLNWIDHWKIKVIGNIHEEQNG